MSTRGSRTWLIGGQRSASGILRLWLDSPSSRSCSASSLRPPEADRRRSRTSEPRTSRGRRSSRSCHVRSRLHACERTSWHSSGSPTAPVAREPPPRRAIASPSATCAQLRRAGYNARAQRFPFAEYRETVERGTQIAPTRRALPIEALEYSPSTPPGGLRARLVPSGDGCEANDFDGVGRAIALIRRGTCFFAVKARNAAAAGATAALIFNTEQGPFDGTLGDPQAATIPVAAIAGALGTELAGSPNTIFELELVARSVRSSSQNVVADVRPGRSSRPRGGRPSGLGTRGAWHQRQRDGRDGPARNGARGPRPLPWLAVRFAFWGAEEAGLFGSRAYVSTAPKSEIVGYLNFDVLGSRSGEYGIYQVRFAARWLGYFERRGLDASGDRHRRTLGSRALRTGRSSPSVGSSPGTTPATTAPATGSRPSTSPCSRRSLGGPPGRLHRLRR